MEPTPYETMTDGELRMARTLAQQQAADLGKVINDSQKARRKAKLAVEAIEAEQRTRKPTGMVFTRDVEGAMIGARRRRA